MKRFAIDAVVFDCDGTLSAIEGINQLARMNNVEKTVSELTERAMAVTGMTPDIYRTRLAATQPTLAQAEQLARDYWETRTDHIEDVIDVLHEDNVACFIVSAGINPSVKLFADQLNVAAKRVYAVDVYFDTNDNYSDFDHTSPMTRGGGKHDVVSALKQQFSRIVMVGDGMNDVDTKPVVDLFIGFGGHYPRESIKQVSDIYIEACSMLPLLDALPKE